MWTRRKFLLAALAAGGVLLPLAGSYAPGAAIHESLTALRARRRPPAVLEGYREFRGVIHAHTALSHDSRGTADAILSAARAAHLDFLVTTDHYTPRIFTEGLEGVHGSVLVLRGVEVALGCTVERGIGRRCGSVLAIGIREPLHPGPQDQWNWNKLFKDIKAQGALAFIAHPRGMMNPGYYQYADGMEIYDMSDTMRERLVDAPRHLVDLALARSHQDEVLLPVVARANWDLVQWDHFTQERRFVGIAGHDTHQNVSFFGRSLDGYEATFRALNTHILAPTLTSENLVAALREGRCFAAFTVLGDATGFQFVAQHDVAGPLLGVMGEEVRAQEDLVLCARSPIPGAFVLFRNGVPIRREEGWELIYLVARPGVYRVEVSLQVVDRWFPWIFSNPIYVRA